jgi:predicted  nucleic acid-binding Zn-ribbon protein
MPTQIKRINENIKELREHLADVEEIQHAELDRVDGHGRKLQRLEAKTDVHDKRIATVAAAIARLRARVLGRRNLARSVNRRRGISHR